MAKLTIIDHPLVQHKLSLMRDKTTGVKEFRELMAETAMLLCYEATRDLPLKTIETETPQGIAKSNIISGRKLAVVPILRAGLGIQYYFLQDILQYHFLFRNLRGHIRYKPFFTPYFLSFFLPL